MKYAILVYETQEEFAERSDPERRDRYWAAYKEYTDLLSEAGVLRNGSAGLKEPITATTLRIRDGKHEVQDGPFADTREALGGLFVIECADLDTALQWGARCPSAERGSVEVRPLLEDQ